MPLADVCVHSGWPVTTLDKVQDDDAEDLWLEGEPDEEEVEGEPFDCFFMDPGEKEVTSPVGSKKIKQPTILLEGEREDGTPIVLKAEDQVKILAPEILGPQAILFQVDGGPTPLAAPGDLIGWEARLKRVRGSG